MAKADFQGTDVSSTLTKTEMDPKTLQLYKIFSMNRLQRYPSRAVYVFRQISYLERELREFTGQEKLTFLKEFI